MKIRIEYCGEWNYLPRAAGLADKIKGATNREVELIRSGGGVFEISDGDDLVYSKRSTGSFPDEDKIVTMIRNRS